MKQKCYLYHICRKDDKWDFSKGYIGISRKPSKRWASGYSKSQKHIRNALDKYDDIIKYVVRWGNEENIKKLEYLLRPEKNMGWNIAKGGGKPPSPKNTNRSIENVNLNRKRVYKPVSKETRKKMSESKQKIKKQQSKRMTENNPMKGVNGEKHHSFMGWYHTPMGKFGSASLASKANGLSKTTINKRCRIGGKIIKVRDGRKDMIGKYWKDFGWYYTPKE